MGQVEAHASLLGLRQQEGVLQITTQVRAGIIIQVVTRGPGEYVWPGRDS